VCVDDYFFYSLARACSLSSHTPSLTRTHARTHTHTDTELAAIDLQSLEKDVEMVERTRSAHALSPLVLRLIRERQSNVLDAIVSVCMYIRANCIHTRTQNARNTYCTHMYARIAAHAHAHALSHAQMHIHAVARTHPTTLF